MVYNSRQIFLPFCHNARVCRTDGQTDGQTEFSSLDRVCIARSAVIKSVCVCVSVRLSYRPLALFIINVKKTQETT